MSAAASACPCSHNSTAFLNNMRGCRGPMSRHSGGYIPFTVHLPRPSLGDQRAQTPAAWLENGQVSSRPIRRCSPTHVGSLLRRTAKPRVSVLLRSLKNLTSCGFLRPSRRDQDSPGTVSIGTAPPFVNDFSQRSPITPGYPLRRKPGAQERSDVRRETGTWPTARCSPPSVLQKVAASSAAS